MQKLLIRISSVLIASLVSACGVGPDYKRPELAMPTNFKEAPKGWKFAQPRDAQDKGKWWLVFKDPQLNSLEEKVTISNQNIAQYIAQYKQALASIDEARANYWPTVSITGSATRTKYSANNASTSSNTRSSILNDYALQPSASWSPDLVGIIGRDVNASEAAAQASAAQLANIQLSMQSLLAQTYFQLRALDAVQLFLNDTVKAYQKSLDMTKNKYDAGIAARLDVVQSETQLQTTQAQALDNGILRAQYEHAIAVLIGEAPEKFSLKLKNTKFINPVIPIGIPSTLLERRPDIASAERLMAQANEQIGLQIAAYFPILTLTGSDGFSSSTYKKLLSQSSNAWSIGAALAETIFDGGARNARVAGAKAAYEAAVANYKQTVLTALQNVEDNLVALRILEAEYKIQSAAVANANKALEITLNQYKSGTVDYTNVIAAQTTAYAAKQTEAAIVSKRMVSAVQLIQALGGGWDGNLDPKLQTTTDGH